ncbi:Os12g0164450 [Oryza sativa Japonica Group]|uniref:Os12g0164450 protein n=1 Tax=Oryza sativa subsp. japonica TaxID=39947 RepID=A0A0N7KTM3_ORYSJ|nr:hypothetical protein EE612_057989 [Oryza sativa]BAT16018.1 Os12g0164450 [Oryza sativa Japonica Group]
MDGSIGIAHGGVEALDAAAHDAVEHLAHLPLERLEPVSHGGAHGGELRRGLPHVGLPVAEERDRRRVDGVGKLLRGLLEDMDFLEEAAGVAPVLALSLLGEAFLQGEERRRPRERGAGRRRGEVVRLERGGAVGARDGGDERPRDEVEHAAHGVDGRREARLVRARRGQAGPDRLQLPRRRPRAGHAPREGAEVGRGGGAGERRAGRGRARAAEGAVAVGREERRDATAPGRRGVVHEQHREIGQRLARAAELALVDLPRREQHGRRDVREPLPPPHLINAIPRRVAHIERLDRPLMELHHQLLPGRRERAAASRLRHEHPELLLAQNKRLKKPPDPRHGQDLLPSTTTTTTTTAASPLHLPRQELAEARREMALERLQVGLLARRHGHVVAAQREEGAAEGEGRRGRRRALVFRHRHRLRRDRRRDLARARAAAAAVGNGARKEKGNG